MLDGIVGEVVFSAAERLGDGPMLEPLELLRLAGVRGDASDDSFMVDAVFDGFVACNDFFGAARFSTTCDGEWSDDGFNAKFFTVCVDAELFSDERELRKLFLELLLSTSRLFASAVTSDLRNEFVRFGIDALRTDVVADKLLARSERLRSRLC